MTLTRRQRFMKEILKLQGLVFYLPLNEVEGTDAKNYARGTIGQNNPTLNGPTIGTPGKIGRAYSFDGVNDRVDFLTSFDPSYSRITIGGIIVLDTAGQGTSRTIFGKRTTFGAIGMRWQLSVSNLNQFYFGRSGSQAAFNTYGNNYPKDTPFFFVVQRTSTNTQLYINGVLVENQGVTTDGSKADATTRMGAIDPTPAEFFRGKMQHFFIVNTDIGSAKILKLAHVSGFA